MEQCSHEHESVFTKQGTAESLLREMQRKQGRTSCYCPRPAVLDHIAKETNHSFLSLIASAVRDAGAPCSHGVPLPTELQDRYDYVILRGIDARVRSMPTIGGAVIPLCVFGTIFNPVPNACAMLVPDTGEFLIMVNSGAIGFLYVFARLVAGCISHEQQQRSNIALDVDPQRTVERLKSSSRTLNSCVSLVEATLFDDEPWKAEPISLTEVQEALASRIAMGAITFLYTHEIGHLLTDFHYSHRKRFQATGCASIPVGGIGQSTEFNADFFALQATITAAKDDAAGWQFAYAGIHAFFTGLQLLHTGVECTLGRSQMVPCSPTLSSRRAALREGLEVYLHEIRKNLIGHHADETSWGRSRSMALALDSLVGEVSNVLVSRIATAWQPKGLVESRLNAYWRPLIREPIIPHEGSGVDLSGHPFLQVGFEEMVLNLQRITFQERSELAEIAESVVWNLLFRAVSAQQGIREPAERALTALDPDTANLLPPLRLRVARESLQGRLFDIDGIEEAVSHYCTRLRCIAGAAQLSAPTG